MGLAGLAGGVAGNAVPLAPKPGSGRPSASGHRSASRENPCRQPKDLNKDVKEPPKAVAPGGPITSIAAELRELASLRDAGILTDEELTQQKQRLLPQ
jgi:Short C-terminal domain